MAHHPAMVATRFLTLSSFLLAGPIAAAPVATPAWHHPLYLGNGDVWRQRIPVRIENATTNALVGVPMALRIGDGPGDARLEGRGSEDVRVADASGKEMLFAILDSAGERVERGPIPRGGQLYLPVECAASSAADYFIYFDNPSAWRVPDFLDVGSPDVNGGFEVGTGTMAKGWIAKDEDAAHRAIWPSDGARSGARCLRHEVDAGAEPNWLGATRRIAPVIPGSRYQIRAWVRAEDVKGQAGWFIHTGGPAGLISNKVFGVGGGTYDWKEVRVDLSIPVGASWMTIGTSLRGTGRAWFDDLTIECDPTVAATISARPAETLALSAPAATVAWPSDEAAVRRMPVRFTNLSDSPVAGGLGWIWLPSAFRGTRDMDPVSVSLAGRAVPFTRLGEMLLFDCPLPPMSRLAAHVYLGARPRPATAAEAARTGLGSDIPSDYLVARRTKPTDPADFAPLLKGTANLVKNPDFTSGATLPDGWGGASQGDAAMTTDKPGLFGERCARMNLPKGNRSWRGWRQAVPVKAGRTYLFGTWAKCRGLEGEARLHAHLLTPQRRMVASSAFASAGEPLSADSDWTLWFGTIRIPDDGAFLELHLTANCGGTLWHDGALVAEIARGEPGSVEARQTTTGDEGLVSWPVNPIVKVFREDAPPERPLPAEISLARNESEPLQLALRSGMAMSGLTVEVTPPISKDGARLPDPTINVVGYVPIDHPTSYFRSDAAEWHRKFPTTPGQCDGWAGWWPDPLLPARPLDLKPNETQPIWITFRAPSDAAPGEYLGTIRLKSGGQIVREFPYSLRVWGFSLPEERHVIAIYDVRPGKQWFDGGAKRDDVERAMMRFLSDRRLCADHVPAEPVFKRQGEGVTADFGAFDAAATWYFGDLHMPAAYFPHFFYLFGWAHPPKKILGEEPYEGGFPYEGKDRSKLRPEYARVYQAALRLFWDHLKAKGWADKMLLYISDEPHFTHEFVRAQMRALCDMIHGVDPKIPIYSSTWRHCPEWDGYLNVWGIGHYGCFPMDEATLRQKNGDRIWFTTDGQMCTDTPFCAIERLLPHYCFHHGADAYEFWGVDWLTYDPYEFGWHRYINQSDQPGNHYYVRYPNGDGYLTYPGQPVGVIGPVSTIRLEQARDGAEDYEYLRLLKEVAARKGPGAQAASAILQRAAALVPVPNAGGRYSTRILPDPDAVPALRRRAAEAIEGR
ncbi:MAG TPA: DUF4091 domain-containing protein [Verrucomicrobiae bacterium]|nr:DUF4091 domain-containing protein [Verrucomicrobiae bacterium]